MTLTGKCRCSAVTYTLTMDERMAVYACHCKACQTWSGSSFALHALLPEGALSLDATPIEYTYETNGQQSSHYLCGTCHTRLYNTTAAAPGMCVLRAGTLDGNHALAPMAHIWTTHKQPWLSLPADVPTWPESPTPEAFSRALKGMG